jgi:hypothetical protein
MITRAISPVAGLLLAALAAGPAAAQTAPVDVTFAIPVNLTRLPPELTQISLRCRVESPELASRTLDGQVDLPIVQGEVVTTVQVVVPVAAAELRASAAGTPASYTCRLFAYHQQANSAWHDLHASGNDVICGLMPRPSPITGTFNW